MRFALGFYFYLSLALSRALKLRPSVSSLVNHQRERYIYTPSRVFGVRAGERELIQGQKVGMERVASALVA